MAINKKLIHFNTFENFNSKKLSANIENTKYTLGVDGEIQTGSPDILYQSIVYIKDTKQQWTHGLLYDGSKLISGTNIKTINGQSLLGNGDLEIQGLKTYIFDYNNYTSTITQEELNKVLESDKIYIKNDNTLVEVTVKNESDSYLFLTGYDNSIDFVSEYHINIDKNNLTLFTTFNSADLVTDSELEDLTNSINYNEVTCPHIEDGLVLEDQEIIFDPDKITILIVGVASNESIKMFHLRSSIVDFNSSTVILYGKYTDNSLLKATYNQENQTLTFNIIELSGGSNSSGGAYALVEHGTNDTTFTLTPNTFHVWDEVTNLTLTLGSETTGVANEYLFQFTSGSAATTLSLPSDLKWANDSAPTIKSNMIYQVSILKGLASVLEFSNTNIIIFPVIKNTVGYNNEDYARVYEYFVSTYNLTITNSSPSNGVVITETLICEDPNVGGVVLKVSLNLSGLLLWTQEAINDVNVLLINSFGLCGTYTWD